MVPPLALLILAHGDLHAAGQEVMTVGPIAEPARRRALRAGCGCHSASRCVFALFPFYWMAITSLKPNQELYNRKVMPLIVHTPDARSTTSTC